MALGYHIRLCEFSIDQSIAIISITRTRGRSSLSCVFLRFHFFDETTKKSKGATKSIKNTNKNAKENTSVMVFSTLTIF